MVRWGNLGARDFSSNDAGVTKVSCSWKSSRASCTWKLQARYQIQLIYTWVSFIHVTLSGLRLHFHEGSQKDSSSRFQKSILSILEIQYWAWRWRKLLRGGSYILGMYIRSTLPHPHMKSHSVQLQLAEKTLSAVGECESLWNNCTIRSDWACARGCQTKVKSDLKSSAKNSSIKPPRFKSCTNSCFSGEAWKLLMDRIELTILTTMTMSEYATLVQHVPRSTNIAPVIPIATSSIDALLMSTSMICLARELTSHV